MRLDRSSNWTVTPVGNWLSSGDVQSISSFDVTCITRLRVLTGPYTSTKLRVWLAHIPQQSCVSDWPIYLNKAACSDWPIYLNKAACLTGPYTSTRLRVLIGTYTSTRPRHLTGPHTSTGPRVWLAHTPQQGLVSDWPTHLNKAALSDWPKHLNKASCLAGPHTSTRQGYLTGPHTSTGPRVWLAHTPQQGLVSDWPTHLNKASCLTGPHTSTGPRYLTGPHTSNRASCLTGPHTSIIMAARSARPIDVDYSQRSSAFWCHAFSAQKSCKVNPSRYNCNYWPEIKGDGNNETTKTTWI